MILSCQGTTLFQACERQTDQLVGYGAVEFVEDGLLILCSDFRSGFGDGAENLRCEPRIERMLGSSRADGFALKRIGGTSFR